jgi:hypothetical protein
VADHRGAAVCLFLASVIIVSFCSQIAGFSIGQAASALIPRPVARIAGRPLWVATHRFSDISKNFYRSGHPGSAVHLAAGRSVAR